MDEKLAKELEKYIRTEIGGSEMDLVDDLLKYERAQRLIGISHSKGINALDEFLLDCEWITADEREDIMERIVLVKEEE